MDRLHKFWWLWLPILIMALQIPMEIFLPPGILSMLHSEQGPHEALEFIVLAIAFIVALSTLCHINWKAQKWLGAWVFLAAICCFYVGGEEISWGQHFVRWSTPEFWMNFNDQGETNLHNTSSWLDQKPRLILFIGVIVGGLIIPALQRYKPLSLPSRFTIIYPSAILAITALFILGIHIIDTVDEAMNNIVIFERASEVEELYLFYFVLLYLVVLRRRILQNQG